MILLLSIGCFIFCGCTPEITYVNDVEPYSRLIGKKFSFKYEGCIFQETDEKFIVCLSDYSSRYALSLPENIQIGKVNSFINGKLILDIIPKGTIIEVKNVKNVKTIENSVYVYEVVIIDNNINRFGLLNANWLTHSTRDNPFVPLFKGNYLNPVDATLEEFIWIPKLRSGRE